ncbi:ABC transporter ATP-binding protein [Demequina sp. TTPB684]|uniref:ABC transporter ATP-binding protein n=1 Tax=unclassified Demequina TaxID=2620311 RepID=UPI001CF50562|nr:MULTISPECIES: ABC transporter ATP-binding protein [unclassified Demequina]MCB2411735.1 ABC transporter ATP-binding protein [Demequina sp. TTPB684]UPU87598.1 ABC transporter ATP-binding protein [Demequina sp. TMPB413]
MRRAARTGEDSGPALRLREVNKTYPSGDTSIHALENVSLDVEAGEMVAVMGTSGSGKSTLLAIAGALLTPTSGVVEVGGLSLGTLGRRQLAAVRRERIGFVFQDFNLMPALTVLENVALPLDLAGASRATARSEARRALASVNMRQRSSDYPDDLSGGQQQRVAIARAIVGTRGLLLADEPTGALDSVTGDHVLAGLRERVDEGGAVVLVTHDPRHAAWADRIVYLADGRIIDQSTASRPEQLLAGEVR